MMNAEDLVFKRQGRKYMMEELCEMYGTNKKNIYYALAASPNYINIKGHGFAVINLLNIDKHMIMKPRLAYYQGQQVEIIRSKMDYV